MSIYTKTGDHGLTSLASGQRVPKCCDRLESYGDIDELNSNIGMLITFCSNDQDVHFLTAVQNLLFVIGGHLATESQDATNTNSKSLIITAQHITDIEHQIDDISKALPPLRAFILPGGSPASSVAHICRTICRRAERHILRLHQSCPVQENVITYINRLSDYLFVLARKLNTDAGVPDIEWHRGGN